MSKFVLGLSGLATVGKDSFCQGLIERLYTMGFEGKRFALADELKEDLRDFLIKSYEIDIYNCTPEEKEIVRPILVAYGKVHRHLSKGTHWTSKLEEKINADDCDVAIVTDIRYDVFEEDELYWLKEKMKGVFVHISRYDYDEKGNKKFFPPPNEDEAAEDPKLSFAADYRVEWPSADRIGRQVYVDKFVNFIEHLIK